MFIGWGVLLQAGAFIARYFRHVPDSWWFKMHRGLQVLPIFNFSYTNYVFSKAR